MITPAGLREAVDAAVDALSALTDRDWDRAAGSLEWSCRHTLDHIVNALVFYSTQLATRSRERVASVRTGDPTAEVDALLVAVGVAGAILAEVATAAPPQARGYHPLGMADVEGFLAMGCDEVLVHTYDITSGLDAGFRPPPDLCARVLARLFPWAPDGHEPWKTLLWANGRRPLGDHPQLDPDWRWHCAPLDEWDGTGP